MITIPTINQLYTGILNDLQAQYGDTISPVGKVMLRAFAAAQAAKLKLIYLNIGGTQKNIFVDTADPVSMGGTLERFGMVKIGRLPFPAVPAEYNVIVTGTIGAVIPAATTFQSDDDSLNPSMMFILDNAYTLVSGTNMIVLRALTPGTISALNLSDTLTLASPLANVNNSASVFSVSQLPLDAETIEQYRKIVINSFQLNPTGGSAVDYRLWSEDAQGVVNVYPYASAGNINEIDLYVEAIPSDSTDGKGTPSGTILAAVQSVIEFNPNTNLPVLERGRRPLGVWQVNYLPITVLNILVNIQGYTNPTLTAAITSLIQNAIVAAINQVRPFVSAADILADKNDIISVNTLIGIIINAQPGSTFGSVSFTVNGISYQSYTFMLGNIPFINIAGVTFS